MSKQAATAGISDRESEILTLIGEHRSNAEIGAQLFISVRTVESHVSSLLRKLGAPDRRALAGLAGELVRAERTDQTLAGLPSPLTPFIGRANERSALRDAVSAHREVTAVGPGGVGKTRLALAVAADLAGDFPDGVWFVDLVPVTDPAMVDSAVAAALGLGEQHGRGIDDSVLAALADRRVLLVLDNCEHLADGVAPFLERLLERCPEVSVLATSRARLMVPFERVYSVPPLSLDEPGDDARNTGGAAGSPDAVALFVDRAAAVGWTVDDEDLDQVADVCRKLDGVALAIELAAARLPVLGLDGLVSGLSDHLRLLVGGYRADDRHRSVRAMLDWSQALLAGPDLTLLRRVSVFVSPFTASAAATVAGFSPLEPGHIADGLARLAEQSLLSVAASAGGTRYRALETIRQYGTEQLAGAGELNATRARHLRWCLSAASELAEDTSPTTGVWRARFDAVADDLRAALSWAAAQPGQRDDTHHLALSLAHLAFTRNLVGESQQRYEQAAALTDDAVRAAAALRWAANVAACRMRGDDAYRLWQAAADVAHRAGDTAAAARDLATTATTYFRKAGTFAQPPPRDEAIALVTRAGELAGDDLPAQAAVALAECTAQGYAFFADQTEAQTGAPAMTALAERAVELAHRLGDPVAEGAALHAMTGAQRRAGDTFAAAATARRRVELLQSVPVTPDSADELIDALTIATATSIGVGDLPSARRWSRQLRDLPLLAEVGHIATSQLIMADALAGYGNDVIASSGQFLDGWTQAGRPRGHTFGPVAAAVAMIHGLCGDEAARAEWLAVVDQLGVSDADRSGYAPTFDAITLLHHGQATLALERLDTRSGEANLWRLGILLHWHVALRAEAAVLAGHPDAGDHLAAARPIVGENPVANAILDRAAALLNDDRERLLATAIAFEAAGCPYQQARTLILAGPDTAPAGNDALINLGFTRVDAAG
ncbi:LuxR C-terminal-related transcriptional regulator [Phytoactinopolyspora halotolerans]|uniref:LuxR C-terminal-related transcriptional regulator n=1 Tax=Phytoactinopolyspora halotolerans TaxID=1981512 RepID=UPI001C2073D8|nr:LuxR C-terminal-related transcriptional regulator [Phytoactinopolyspora halotolerans]